MTDLRAALWSTPPATGVGSLPGTDMDAACRFVFDELEDFAYLPELPARGPWAGMTGRTAALLSDLPVDLGLAGWRLADRSTAEQRRAATMLARDLDVLQQAAAGFDGLLKVQVCGPATLAATLDLARGDKVLGDYGARAELVASLADGVAAHVADVAERLPGARLVVQIDEPAAPAVLAGAVPTVSGFSRFRAVGAAEVSAGIAALAAAVGVPVIVHCCAAAAPFDVLAADGVAGLSFDLRLDLDDDRALESLATAVERGVRLVVGAVPTSAADPDALTSAEDVARMRARTALLWQRLDQPPDALAARVAISPSCGLASVTSAYARAATIAAVQVARALADDPT